MENKHVFISYSSANKAIADATCHILEEYGIPCWIAPRNITPGKTWAGNIVQAIRECSLMVLIYSEESNKSSQVANEVDKAFSHGKIIIPFLVDATPMNDDFDYYLSRKHWLVAYPDYKEMLMPLVEAVAANIGMEIKPQQPATRIPDNPSPTKDNMETPDNPHYEEAVKSAKKSLESYDLDTAFAELIHPALNNHQEARFLIRTILTTYARMKKLDTFRFKYIKEQADAGHAFAQYMMCRYYTHIERNDEQTYHYARLCADQGESYGILELELCYEFGFQVEKDINRTHELLDKAVNMGDPFAMLRLAKDNLYGWTRKRNAKIAFKLLKRCMEKHVPESFAIMGDMFRDGNGLEADEKRALELYQQALSERYLEAYEIMAWLHIINKDYQYKEDTDIQKGISLLRKGTEYGVVECLAALAYCYRDGIGVPQKAEQAYRWYKKAAEAGDKFSFFMMGFMHYYGEGCEQNDAEAWKWLRQGATLPLGACCYLLGLMCQEGHGQEGKTEADCVAYYEEAIYLGGGYAADAGLKLYHIFRTRSLESNPLIRDDEDAYREYDWAPKDNKRALHYLKQVARTGLDALTPFKYGAILCTEGHDFTDELEGINYLKQAAEKGEPRAAVMLAQIYEKGEWVDEDKQEAHRYYQLAADHHCGDGYSGLAKELCAQLEESDDKSEEDSKKILRQTYEYVCKADELGCKAGNPLNDTMINFMLEDDQLTPEEGKQLISLNEKYIRQGDLQSIVDRGVMYHMGRLIQPDWEKAIRYYQWATRLGKEYTAKNLGDLYSGKDDTSNGLPPLKQDKATAAYWYSKGKEEYIINLYLELRKEVYQQVEDFERSSAEVIPPEYFKWVFPYFCDPAFTSEAALRIFEWDDFTEMQHGDSYHWPKELKDSYTAYIEFRDLLINAFVYDAQLPELKEEDFFPCLSIPHLLELSQAVGRAWNHLVKQEDHPSLQPHRQALDKITLLSSDWEGMLDLAETIEDTDFQLLLIDIAEISIGLDNLANVYWRLIALNILVEESDYRLPDSFVKEFADQFFEGTQVLPQSRAIARRLYELIPYTPGVEEKLKQC